MSPVDHCRLLLLPLAVEVTLIQWNANNSAYVSKNTKVDQMDFGGIKTKLSIMSKDTDIITSFTAFEIYLILMEEPNGNGAKLQVNYLNEKVSTLYTRFSSWDCTDYRVTKKFLIEEFRAHPAVYRARELSLHRSGMIYSVEWRFKSLCTVKKYCFFWFFARWCVI